MSCSSCRHWGGKPYEYLDCDGDESLTAPHRICGRIILIEFHEPPVSPAFTRDGSGYKAELWTAAEFSCGLFEEASERAPAAPAPE